MTIKTKLERLEKMTLLKSEVYFVVKSEDGQGIYLRNPGAGANEFLIWEEEARWRKSIKGHDVIIFTGEDELED